MKNQDYSFNLLCIIIVAGLVAACLPSAHAADAEKKRTRTGTYQASKGQSGSATGTTTRAKGEVQRDATRTNQNGQTDTRTSDRKFDAATGTGTVNAATTQPDGRIASRAGNFTKNADGSVNATGTTTGFDGKRANYTTTTTKTDTASTTTGTLTGQNGKTTTLNSSTTRADGRKAKDTIVTGPGGKSAGRVTATKLNGDGTGTRTVEITQPDGTKETRIETFTVAKTNP